VIEALPEVGEELYALAARLELEGLVAKKGDSIYQPGERTDQWRKIRRPGAVEPERFKRP